MGFYESIAEYYEYIFPLSKVQVDFVNLVAGGKVVRILDIGCGTGSLSIALASDNNQVVGIDLDATMIQRAVARAQGRNPNARFAVVNMLELNAHFEPKSFDIAICFGNTLVHLDSMSSVLEFFLEAKNLLKPGGKLLLQIVNYDRILDRNLSSLPTLDNEYITFERNYNIHSGGKSIDFQTILTVKATNNRTGNSIPLLPVRQAEMIELLDKAGFVDIQSFGSFKKEPFTLDSPALVLEAAMKM